MLRRAAALAAFFLSFPAQAEIHVQTPLPRDVFQERTTTPGLIWGSRIVIEDKSCCESPPGAPSPHAEEAKVMAEIPRQALRSGRVLDLRLDGFRTLKITDCDDRNACGTVFREHRLVAWWPGALRIYVIDVRTFEGEMVFLVRADDGSVTVVGGPLILSPSARHAISWDPSLVNGPSMQLLDLTGHLPAIYRITPEFTCRGERVHPGKQPVWLSGSEVAFDDSTLGTSPAPRFRLTLQIVGGTNLRWECHL